MFRSISLAVLGAVIAAIIAAQSAPPDAFRFVIIGDRTGETTPGVYSRILQQAAATNPALILTVGDSIQGVQDATAEMQWLEFDRLLAPYPRIPFYLAAGNHDVWNARSAELFRQHAKHDLHYSFDYGRAHFTVLDNSRTESLSPDEMAFLTADLKAHAAQPLKFIVTHRPSWLVPVMVNNPDFPLQRIAKEYGVQYVVAGHLHGLLTAEIDGVNYISVQSSGGNLRATKRYEDGWFYGFLEVNVRGATASIAVREIGEPFGKGRSTSLADWGRGGLVQAR